MRFVITLNDVIDLILGCSALIFFVWFAKTFGVKADKKEQKEDKEQKEEADKE